MTTPNDQISEAHVASLGRSPSSSGAIYLKGVRVREERGREGSREKVRVAKGSRRMMRGGGKRGIGLDGAGLGVECGLVGLGYVLGDVKVGDDRLRLGPHEDIV